MSVTTSILPPLSLPPPPLFPSHSFQLRDVGRKYRTLHEESRKELEGVKAENSELKKKLEDVPPPSEATSAASASEIANKIQVH